MRHSSHTALRKAHGHDRQLRKVCNAIRTLKIQGAASIAKAAITEVARIAGVGGDLGRAAEALVATRPTEPMLHNALAYFQAHVTEQNATALARQMLASFEEGEAKIASFASLLIKDGMTVQTHCHSSTVVKALLTAQSAGKAFRVGTTETRPLFQGRKTATELAAAGVPVTHFVDSGMRIALKEADAVFIGADALLSDGKVANKIGSEALAELAHARGIPVYVLASLWKFDDFATDSFKEFLEERDGAEVWKGVPKGIHIENPAFEFIMPRYVTAWITDLGIRDPFTAVREIQQRRKLLFPSGERTPGKD